MRVKLTLQAEADAVYDLEYHHNLRGRFGKSLQGTEFTKGHGEKPQEASAYTFSNIFPWGSRIKEGKRYSLTVASPSEGLLAAIAEDVQRNPEFNVGEMEFTVTDVKRMEADVGEPGTQGVLTTASGVLVRIHDDEYDTYDITPEGNPSYRCWQQDYSLEPFIDHIENNLAWKHNQFEEEYLRSPTDTAYPLFEEYDFIKSYGLDLEVTSGTTVTYIMSKWYLGYEVQDNDHRRHLNLALDVGIGERNGMGLGFVNNLRPEEVYDK